MFGLKYFSLNVEVLKSQGKMLFALLALLGATVASAAPAAPAAPAALSGGRWQIQNGVLPAYSVFVSTDLMNPQFRVVLPNGESVDLPAINDPELRRLPLSDVKALVEDVRIVLESAIRITFSERDFAYAVVEGNHARTISMETSFSRLAGLRPFDPVSEYLHAKPLGSSVSEFAVPGRGQPIVSDSINQINQLTAREMANVQKLIARKKAIAIFNFLKGATYDSAKESFKLFRKGNIDLSSHVQEWGVQISFRGEIQIGIGKFNVIKNFPLLLSFGYNREKRHVVFRKGIRKEKMSKGAALSIGGKLEIKFYRLYADYVNAVDARVGYAGIRGGSSVYPPNLVPFLSPVFDTAPGFQSVGVSAGLNVADLFPGTQFLNTVTEFDEEQRVYSALLPDPMSYLRELQQQINASGGVFGDSPTRGGRCESLFTPTLFSVR